MLHHCGLATSVLCPTPSPTPRTTPRPRSSPTFSSTDTIVLCFRRDCFFMVDLLRTRSFALPHAVLCLMTVIFAKRYHCAEELLQPSFTSEGVRGIPDTSLQTKCGVDIRKNFVRLYRVVWRHGLFSRTGERMCKEVTTLTPFTMKFLWLLHKSERTQYGSEDPLVFPQHLSAVHVIFLDWRLSLCRQRDCISPFVS